MLWGKEFNEGNSYKLEGIGIHCYQGNKHFALSDIVSIDDIGIIPYVKDDEHHAEGGVLSSEEYSSCPNCKDRVSHISETIAKCNACDSMVKISECASYQTACVIFRASGSKQQHKIINLLQLVLQWNPS